VIQSDLFGDGENVTPSKVVGDLQLGDKGGHFESPGSSFVPQKILPMKLDMFFLQISMSGGV